MEIVIGLVYPEVDRVQQPTAKYSTDVRYACAGLLQHKLAEVLCTIVPVHLQQAL